MNCNEARRMVTSYVKKELSDKELEQFLHHVEHCRDCMDELDTYYTVYQALDLLDSGQHHDYNFGNMLKEDLRASHRLLAWRKVCGVLLAVLLLATEFLMGFSVYTGFEMKQGQQEYTLIQRAMLRLDRQEEERISEELSEGSQEVRDERETAVENLAELPKTETVIENPAAPEISNPVEGTNAAQEKAEPAGGSSAAPEKAKPSEETNAAQKKAKPAGGASAVPEKPKPAEGSGAGAGKTESIAENRTVLDKTMRTAETSAVDDSGKSKKDRVATEDPEQKLR